MTRFLAFYVPTIIFFLAVDALWLTTVGEAFFKPRLAHLLADKVDYRIAALFYLLFGVALVIFAISPTHTQGGPWWMAGLLGAFLGLTAYGAYDLTNLATLRGYTASVAVVDMAWGTFLSGGSAIVGFVAGPWFLASQ